MNIPVVYLAGPLFSEQDRAMLLSIEQAFVNAGMRCFVPHREVGDLSSLRAKHGEELARQYVFDSDVQGIKECSILCALLDGPDVDSGTAAEMGFAHAFAKPIFGLCTDGIRRGRTINNVIWGLCDRGQTIYSCLDEMVNGVVDLLARDRRLVGASSAGPNYTANSPMRMAVRSASCE